MKGLELKDLQYRTEIWYIQFCVTLSRIWYHQKKKKIIVMSCFRGSVRSVKHLGLLNLSQIPTCNLQPATCKLHPPGYILHNQFTTIRKQTKTRLVAFSLACLEDFRYEMTRPLILHVSGFPRSAKSFHCLLYRQSSSFSRLLLFISYNFGHVWVRMCKYTKIKGGSGIWVPAA